MTRIAPHIRSRRPPIPFLREVARLVEGDEAEEDAEENGRNAKIVSDIADHYEKTRGQWTEVAAPAEAPSSSAA